MAWEVLDERLFDRESINKIFKASLIPHVLASHAHEYRLLAASGGHFLCHKDSDLARLKEKSYFSVDFVYPLSDLRGFGIKSECQ